MINLVMLRAKRDAILAATDFTQVADAPFTQEQKDAYAKYRQALRDLPSGLTINSNEPIWPTEPGK